MNKIKKTESIAEFLARGGKINVIPSVVPELKQEQRRSKNGGPAVILTMDEHDLYHGEKKTVKSPSKKKPDVDFNALPEVLKNKYLKELRDEEDFEEDEE